MNGTPPREGSAPLHHHDIVIIGGGLAGLRAACEAADRGMDVAVVTKVHPLRSHSVAAQGGINAALGNAPGAKDDRWEDHAFDTVKGSDYLADQDAVDILTREAPRAVISLEHMGTVFSRTPGGMIAQRPFGGAGFPRTCYATDRTGLNILHTLYEQILLRGVTCYEEYFVTSLVMDGNGIPGTDGPDGDDSGEGGARKDGASPDMPGANGSRERRSAPDGSRKNMPCANGSRGGGSDTNGPQGHGSGTTAPPDIRGKGGEGATGSRCVGCVAMNIADGSFHGFVAGAVLLATGGYGRLFARSTNAVINTGDGAALAFKEGFPLKDMEFVQFHPTTLDGTNILITEGARGEGGLLFNNRGQRFMKDYAPGAMELAPRDIVARAIQSEIDVGRGFGGGHVHLDLTGLGEDRINERLPGIRAIAMDFAGVDPVKEPIPIQPGQHYSMGGVACSCEGRTPLPGLYTAGEAACVSVHGANRLGGNSLLEAVVFGKIVGETMADDLRGETDPGNPKAEGTGTAKGSGTTTTTDTAASTDTATASCTEADPGTEHRVASGHGSGASGVPQVSLVPRVSQVPVTSWVSRTSPGRLVEDRVARERDRIRELLGRKGGEHVPAIRDELTRIMFDHFGVFRDGDSMREGLGKVRALAARAGNMAIQTTSLVHNHALVHALELEYLLLMAESVALGALERRESRGSHFRTDYPSRDDERFLAHTMTALREGRTALWYAPVTLGRYDVRERVY